VQENPNGQTSGFARNCLEPIEGRKVSDTVDADYKVKVAPVQKGLKIGVAEEKISAVWANVREDPPARFGTLRSGD
jgi:hypothetical protein